MSPKDMTVVLAAAAVRGATWVALPCCRMGSIRAAMVVQESLLEAAGEGVPVVPDRTVVLVVSVALAPPPRYWTEVLSHTQQGVMALRRPLPIHLSLLPRQLTREMAGKQRIQTTGEVDPAAPALLLFGTRCHLPEPYSLSDDLSPFPGTLSRGLRRYAEASPVVARRQAGLVLEDAKKPWRILESAQGGDPMDRFV